MSIWAHKEPWSTPGTINYGCSPIPESSWLLCSNLQRCQQPAVSQTVSVMTAEATHLLWLHLSCRNLLGVTSTWSQCKRALKETECCGPKHVWVQMCLQTELQFKYCTYLAERHIISNIATKVKSLRGTLEAKACFEAQNSPVLRASDVNVDNDNALSLCC